MELMSYCREKFEINNNYSAADMRIIAGLRYSIKTRYIDKLYLPDYVFVKDASMELITSLKENNVPGFEVTVSYTRQYHTNLAAHLLGYTGLMTAEEYTTYKTQGYPMSATVGKDGAELAFEKYLHGTNGTAIVTKNASGTVTGTTYTTEPEPGDQVSLTIDLDLQSAAEQSLTKGIENMKSKSTKTSDAVGGGALVAVDVATGQPLAIANYPTYDLQTLFQSEENYKAVSEADNQPLFNRALLGQYSPGSTFKPCTAIAGLTEGVITTGTRIQCTGTFRKYEDTGYAPKCWIASSGVTHGNDNVTEAIRDSCNIFFYTVGDSLPIDTLARYAAAFGLGEHTGIELPESTGQMATEAVKKKLENTNWYVGDSLQAAIGQSYSLFTPLQLAEYAMTAASSSIKNEAEVLSTVETSDYNWAAVQKGMYLVANDRAGSAYETFGDYGVKVAAKTGTAQLGDNQVNNAIFICYAPYDNPKVAVAVVVGARQRRRFHRLHRARFSRRIFYRQDRQHRPRERALAAAVTAADQKERSYPYEHCTDR